MGTDTGSGHQFKFQPDGYNGGPWHCADLFPHSGSADCPRKGRHL